MCTFSLTAMTKFKRVIFNRILLIRLWSYRIIPYIGFYKKTHQNSLKKSIITFACGIKTSGSHQ